MPKIWGFPLTSIVALTTILSTTVLHCDRPKSISCTCVLSVAPVALLGNRCEIYQPVQLAAHGPTGCGKKSEHLKFFAVFSATV